MESKMEEQSVKTDQLPADRFELLDINYDTTPWYRRRWFIVSSILLFMPLTLALVLSGDIYMKRKTQVYRLLPKQKNIIMMMCCALMALGLFRAMA